jgi:hypothetical protein
MKKITVTLWKEIKSNCTKRYRKDSFSHLHHPIPQTSNDQQEGELFSSQVSLTEKEKIA